MIYLGRDPVGIATYNPVSPEEWVKPDAWPDIEALPVPSGNESRVYYLYDCTTPVRYAGFSGCISATELAIASYKNGALSAFDASGMEKAGESRFIQLPNDCDYAVVRVNDGGKYAFANNSSRGLYSQANNHGGNQPCLWMYGKIYNSSQNSVYVNQSAGIDPLTLQRARLELINMSIGYGFLASPLKSLILNGGDFQGEGKLWTSNAAIRTEGDIILRNARTDQTALFGVGTNCRNCDLSGLMADGGEIGLSTKFQNNRGITSLLLRTNGLKITTIQNAFNGCVNIKTIDMTGCDLSECTNTGGAFSSCYALENLNLGSGLTITTDLTNCLLLTHDSLMTVINGLGTASSGAQLKLSGASKGLLSADEIAVATGKGWSLP